MSGYLENLSEQQAKAFEQFKERAKDCIEDKHDDAYLLRFLRAREFDVQKSVTMFTEAMKWRKEIGADTLLKTYKPIPIVQKYRTGGFLPGTDKLGCPIYLDPYGQIDMTGILKCCKKQDLTLRFVWIMETVFKRCHEAMLERGPMAEQVLFLYDLKGLGLRHFDRPSVDIYLALGRLAESRYPEILRKVIVMNGVDIYLALARLGESRYPEILRKVIVMNAPRLFPIAWKLVAPVLHEATRKKVCVFSNNYHEELLKEIDKENIPALYGGTLVDSNGDPACSEWICWGGMVPEECYNQSEARDDMTTVVVGRGSTVQLDYDVKIPKSVLRYEFRSDGCDVGFGVFRKTSGERQKAGEMDAILTSSRVNSHMVPEDGFVECSDPGTYVVRFDNTYSWTRSKTIRYYIEILEPQNEDSFIIGAEDKTNTAAVAS